MGGGGWLAIPSTAPVPAAGRLRGLAGWGLSLGLSEQFVAEVAQRLGQRCFVFAQVACDGAALSGVERDSRFVLTFGGAFKEVGRRHQRTVGTTVAASAQLAREPTGV